MDLKHVTVNTQSSIRIEGSKVLYIDPLEIAGEDHDADVIFVTHEHYDHFDPKSIARIAKADTVLVTPKSMEKKVLSESGLDADRCIFLEPGEEREICGLAVQAIPAYNKLKPFHTRSSRWLGYIVTLDGTTYYVAGDTDPNDDNRKVRCDVALIPIGGHYTMDWKQAAEFVAEIHPKAAIPTHYGNIVGKPEDGEQFRAAVQAKTPEIHVELKL